ncbi:hypothetical protein BAUCODRAFT_127538 [Baudoinia panamericana UAMH 10762]|uniref:Uncharacterized protein n=1 Tax=Baudoinia panamericana (strain UAMH 10762) TaxID=717646 RepID=M2MHX7_BAUPA|nr:uncharacterized protein BAUCODRAFT_127538 [Baudoinia panamericana UAMH 10762]EMC90863.1 hypothetical protein BAUCODRAFT_127538 [Baudoinia panamericana UAMH 10762]
MSSSHCRRLSCGELVSFRFSQPSLTALLIRSLAPVLMPVPGEQRAEVFGRTPDNCGNDDITLGRALPPTTASALAAARNLPGSGSGSGQQGSSKFPSAPLVTDIWCRP